MRALHRRVLNGPGIWGNIANPYLGTAFAENLAIPMNSAAQRWQHAVRLAPTEASLVGVVAEYLEGMPAAALARLPKAARPAAIRGVEDIVALTLQVAREELMFTGDPETAAQLREMLLVLTEATGRLASMSIDARLPPTQP